MLTKVSYKLFTENHIFDDMTDKQSKILIAAIKVFSEKGYANASTKEIAEEAGVSEGNIFSRFTSKYGLLQAIIQPVTHAIFPTAFGKFSDTKITDIYPTLQDFVEALVKDRVQFMKENANVLKIFLSEMTYNHQLRQDFQNQFIKTAAFYVKAIHHNLTTFKADRQIVNWPDIEILRLMWSIIGGLVVSYLFFNQPVTKIDVNRTVTALIKALSQNKFN